MGAQRGLFATRGANVFAFRVQRGREALNQFNQPTRDVFARISPTNQALRFRVDAVVANPGYCRNEAGLLGSGQFHGIIVHRRTMRFVGAG